ncbi:hypothetical protein [Paenibacillus tundrae]
MKLQFVVGAIFILLVTACSNDTEQAISNVTTTIKDQADNIRDIDNPHVQSIKNGHLENYPTKSVGDAFNDFFGSPTWKHFKAETGEEVVEFTGHMKYQETNLKARLQFVVNENGTFEIGALSFNDVPQNELIKNGVLSAVFDSEHANSNESNTGANRVQNAPSRNESISNQDTKTTNSTQSSNDQQPNDLNGDYYYTDEDGNPLNELSFSINSKHITGTIIINTIDDKTAVIDFSGTLKNGKVKSTFEDDGWGESGTMQLKIDGNTAIATITANENENSTGWGINTGSYEFQKSEP